MKTKKSKSKHLKKKRKKSESSDSDSDNDDSKSVKKPTEPKKKHKKKRKAESEPEAESFDIPLALMSESSKMVPMTKSEWEKRQNRTERVFDETTGRYRLVKGDGEVLEEIVSRDRHKAINKQATKGDGEYFESQSYSKNTNK